MEGRKKTVHRGFWYQDCDDFAAYLNHMARQGWHFREWKAGLVFEQGPPEEAVYTVEVFTDGTEYDTRPEPKTKEFAEYCEAAGWQLIDAKRKFCIFKRIREDAQPIMTDEERLETIAKATRGDIFRPLFTAAWFTALNLLRFSTSFIPDFASDMDLLLMGFWVIMLAASLVQCFSYFLWQARCRKEIEQGKRLFFGKRRHTFGSWYGNLRSFGAAALLLMLVLQGQIWVAVFSGGIIGAAILISLFVSRYRPDSATNQIISVIFSGVLVFVMMCSVVFVVLNDDSKKDWPDPRLTYADMGVDMGQPSVHMAEKLHGILGSWEYANLDYPGNEYLYYNIYETKYAWVMDRIWEDVTHGKANETRKGCTELWNAEEAFRNGAGNYIVRYEGAVWVICPSLEDSLTEEQIRGILEALKGE